MLRTIIQFLGLLLILSIFVAASINSIMHPYLAGALWAKSNFPLFLSWFDISLTGSQYVRLAQINGAVTFALSLFILLGVGRGFFAFVLALYTIFLAMMHHMDMKDPITTSEVDRMQIAQYLSHAGALLFVSGSKKWSGRAPHYYSSPIEKSKKQN